MTLHDRRPDHAPPPDAAGISGKSNLLEALCFAAGCPAAMMRAAALRDLASSEAAGKVRATDGRQLPC